MRAVRHAVFRVVRVRCLALSLCIALAGCANTIDWSQAGLSPAEQVEDTADVVACDKQTSTAAVFANSNSATSTPEWREVMRQKIGNFDACMRAKGWWKVPVIGWQKARPTEPLKDDGGGD